MFLNRINILNFRSIDCLTINFEHNFEILVGLNEAGKSNVIKAASFLDPEVPFSKDDIRDPRHDEGDIEDSYVRFIFKLTKQEIKLVYEKLKSQVLSKKLNVPIITIQNKTFTLEEFCQYKDEALYIVDFTDQTRSFSFWALTTKNVSISPKWKKVKDNNNYVFTENGKQIDLNKYKIVNTDDYEIPDGCLENLDPIVLNSLVRPYVVEVAKSNVPKCVLWTYNEQNLLPGKISFSGFISNPDICIPLKNMFTLAGFADVKTCLTDAQQKTNGVRNVLKKVSENTTQHMMNIWPEWKGQKIDLSQNGDSIDAGIEDAYNLYSLSRRSDGFKRFFTFMLMISAQSITEEISNNLILIDEPDICLHPTGVQYLREELKSIATKNKVIISTHSIFMIDKEEPSRHLIVTKNKETTSVKRADVSNINDEEVIYKALGYSLHELLKKHNIIFEGWRDKKIFEMMAKSSAFKKSTGCGGVSNIGLLHSVGVKDVPNVANLCENYSRKYIIITDSDKPAKEKQKKFDGQGKWLCYDDIDGVKAVTSEDFISNTLINAAANYAIKNNLNEFKVSIDQSIVTDKIKNIENQLNKGGVDAETANKVLNDIKGYLVENVKISDFDKAYMDVVQYLLKAVSEL